MKTWSITLNGTSGVLGSVDTHESQFVIGSDTGDDVFTVSGEGVAERHTWVQIDTDTLFVEDLGGGTFVNGYAVTERVQVEYPASLQVGEITLVIEVKSADAAHAAVLGSMDVTIPARAVTRGKATGGKSVLQGTPAGLPPAGDRSGSLPPPCVEEAPLQGKYLLVREIARGGMGRIYFGEDPQLKRNVAVKVSSVSEAGEDPRFSKEAEVLAQLAHPNIVPIHNIGVDAQSRPFYSMKLVKGRTLQAVLNSIREGDEAAVKEYPLPTLLTVFRKVCDALMFAHSKGILHRDLKPENIMVGEYGEVLVMDWGLAKVLGEREERASNAQRTPDTGDYGMTMEGEVMGTPQYMSPEQAEGMVADLDVRSDIYSLGGILYAILTLRPPIEGTTLNEVLTKVKRGGISAMTRVDRNRSPQKTQAPGAMGEEVPEALRAVTLKALARDRDHRYAAVEAFAADIEAYQNGFATAAENAGALRQLVLFIKRNKALSAAALVFLVAVAGFVVRLEVEKNQSRVSERRALVAQETSRREAAKARIALAEAAEQASNSEQIRLALAGVPEDLRDGDWEYLNARSDSFDLQISAPAGGEWLMVDSCPDAPDSIVGLQTNGQLSLIHTSTGEITPLWMAERKGFAIQGVDVSEDGRTVALVWKKGGLYEFEVRGLRGGERVGSETVASWNMANDVHVLARPRAMIFEQCLLVHRWSSLETWVLQSWEIETGNKKWERSGVQAFERAEDGKSLLTINEKGRLETLSLEDGSSLSMKEIYVGGNDANYPLRTLVKPKSETLFTDRGGSVIRYDTVREKWFGSPGMKAGRSFPSMEGMRARDLWEKALPCFI